MFTIIDEMSYPSFCAEYNLKPLTIADWDKQRIPFDPPYTKADLPYLDFLHWQYNIGVEWMVSEARARLMKGKSATKTISRERTRSKRWRAGSKSMKPKYFWSKRERRAFR